MATMRLSQPSREETSSPNTNRRQRRRCANCPRLKNSAKAGWACASGPPQWKLAALTLVPAYLLSLGCQFLPLAKLPGPVQTFIVTLLLVLILTFVTQPMLVRGCSRWLCPLPPLRKTRSNRR